VKGRELDDEDKKKTAEQLAGLMGRVFCSFFVCILNSMCVSIACVRVPLKYPPESMIQ